MSSNYTDAVRSKGESSHPPPSCHAAAPPQAGPSGEPATAPDAHIQIPGAGDMDTSSHDSDLTTQSHHLPPRINPTKPGEGEILPEGYARNYAGFLVKTSK